MKIRTQMGAIAAGILLLSLLHATDAYWRWDTSDQRRVVDLAGQIRGGAQRAVKLALSDAPYDAAETAVDDLLDAMLHGSPAMGVPQLQERRRLNLAREVSDSWLAVKGAIRAHAAGTLPAADLLRQSEDLWGLSNRLVASLTEGGTGETQILILDWLLLILGLLVCTGTVIVARNLGTTLVATSRTLLDAANEIATTVEQQERVALGQASSVSETMATMDELQASFQQMTEQYETTADLAREALSHTEAGTDAVDTTMTGMGDVKARVENVAEGILRLSEQISQIGEITSTVSDLASRTNMLALNASVEAARAGGEHGKGFAVVAAEIRKLADESRRSTTRIEGLVAEIQQATNSTVMITEEGNKTVDRARDIATSATDAFASLSESMQTTYESTQQALMSVRQQLAAVGQVTEAMAALNSGAEESARGMSLTRDGARRLLDLARQLERVV